MSNIPAENDWTNKAPWKRGLLKTLSSLIVVIAASPPLSAATVSNVSGVVWEGGVAPNIGAPLPSPGLNLGDFNSNISDPTLQIIGNTEIYGGVAHSKKNRFTDRWTMDFGTISYNSVFNWEKTSASFDGRLFVNLAEYNLDENGSLPFGSLTGLVTFSLDPIYGIYGPNPHEVATWDLQVVPVPLPASGLFLISGIRVLAIIRRRKKAVLSLNA